MLEFLIRKESVCLAKSIGKEVGSRLSSQGKAYEFFFFRRQVGDLERNLSL